MERNTRKIGLVNLIVLFLIGGAAFVLAVFSHSFAGQTGSIFYAVGFLVAAISYVQMRLEDSERMERLDFEEMAKSRNDASLFAAADSETLPAARSREQFDRFFVPGFTVVLCLGQLIGAYFCWKWLAESKPVTFQQPAVAMALYGLFALTLFLLGKYSGGVARLDGKRLLRPGASYMLLGAYISFLVAAAMAAVQGGFPKTDLYIARGMVILLGLTGIETLINLIFEIYRPRLKGGPARVVYEGRLIGLLGQPEGLITTAAQALDYQFGFKVSETWFYQFLEKALAWLILVQFGLLLISTCIVFIGPGEEGLLERFGRPLSLTASLKPGLHLKMPWPIDRVARFRTQEIQSINIGFVPDPEKENERTVIWTVSHSKEEFNLLVASRTSGAATNNATVRESGVPVDLLTVGIPVQYQIQNVQWWAYNHTDAGALLERLATREVIRYLVSVDLFDVMSRGREKAAIDLQQRIQASADERKLGVKIVFVGLQDIHPPVKVASAFEGVIGAGQESEAKMRMAEGYAASVVPMAKADAEKRVNDAEAYRATRVAAAGAQVAKFTNQVAAYKASPEVYLQRAYLQTLERGSTNTRKYLLLATNTQDVIIFNLEDKIRPDLLDIATPTPGRK